jgi:hypothetical protein
MRRKRNRAQLAAYVDAATKQEIVRMAAAQDKSISEILDTILGQFLEKSGRTVKNVS